MTVAVELDRGIDALQLQLSADVRARLLGYLELLHKWNRVYNLTAVRDPDRMLTHHILDSLAVVPHLHGTRMLDVGSGAGLPGIPLALALPQANITLIEANHKKATFLKQAAIELELSGVDVVNERVETWAVSTPFDVVISRALADLVEFVSLAGRHCAPHGVLAAMKGVFPHEEIARVPDGFVVDRTVALKVPGLEAERHLVLIRRSARS